MDGISSFPDGTFEHRVFYLHTQGTARGTAVTTEKSRDTPVSDKTFLFILPSLDFASSALFNII